MNWIFLALASAFSYGVYNFFIKISSGHINQIVGALILQIVAALVGSIVLIILKLTNTPLVISSKGITYAILAGLFVGLAEITSFMVFSKGISTSVGTPIIVGGSIVVASVLGILFLKENLQAIHYLAIGLILIGVAILAAK